MSETMAPPIRTLSFLTGDGDNTYGWEEKDDEWVIPMIQKKMDEGYVFWIVRRPAEAAVRLRQARDALPLRSILIKDDASRILFEQGRISMVSQDSAEVVRERLATSAADAAANDTVAHRRPAGG
jgi:hypothetical protein